MEGFLGAVFKLTKFMHVISGIALTFIVLLTTADVVMRAFGSPILGTYEIVAMAGGIVIGFVTPITSWLRGHIFVDVLIKKLPGHGKDVADIITRCIGIGLFVMIGWNVLKIGNTFRTAGEVSNTLQLPMYPIPYAVGMSFFVLSLVLICDICKVLGGKYE
jgi:TRAP-type C4-dicarboxylate transport system permease small subunit